jgi:hypothetical protein
MMIEFLKRFFTLYKNPITIVSILILYLVIYYLFLKKYIIGYISDNWNYFKDKPYILPFSGLIRGNVDNNPKTKGTISRTIHNINLYFRKVFSSFIKMFTKPFIWFLKLVSKVIGNLKNTIDKFRNMATVIRKLFKQTVESTAKRIANSYAAVVYFQEKFKLILRKQAAMFSVFKQYAQSMKFLLYSFSNGPIPRIINFLMYYATLMIVMLIICVLCILDIPFVSWVACPICAICFDKNTEILLENKTEKIKNLLLGQNIKLGGEITGIIRVVAGKTKMFNYNDTLVSGSHLIYESDKWKRVENSSNAKKIVYNENDILYCLITKNNIIMANNNKFSDYQETQDPFINLSIQRMISSHLNKTECVKSFNDICHQYYWGFSGETIINKKRIKNIEIGDFINGTKVIGTIKLNGTDIIWYLYNDVIVSGSQLVNEKGIWIRVHQSIYAKKLDFSLNKMYHLILENNKIIINNLEFTDFCETCNEEINDQIDNLVLEHKNRE